MKRSVIYMIEREDHGRWSVVWSSGHTNNYDIAYQTRRGAQAAMRRETLPELDGRYRVAEYVRREPEE